MLLYWQLKAFMASNSQNIKGIIYRIYNSGAADKVVNILDEHGKKISAIAKGVKKQNSRKAHSIEIGNYIKAGILQGYSTPLITEASLINEHSNWKINLQTITSLQFICEIIDNFAFEENKDPEIFNLLEEVLSKDPQKLTLTLSYFILKLLEHSGNLPEINYYVNTGEPIIVGEGYFSEGIIGYVTQDASNYENKINPLIYKSQRFILSSNLQSVLRLELPEELANSMFRVHLSWLNQVLGKKLKSVDLLMKAI